MFGAQVSPELLDFIRSSGGTVVSSFPHYHEIRARLPLDATELLAKRADVQWIRPADRAATSVVAVQGDVAHRADQARQAFDIDGTGVKIGVLSDSVNYLANSQAAGNLPPVTVLLGQGGVGVGEGTAMLEIVHALAPGASLYFATGNAGVASFAQNIRALQAAGCGIIVDDVVYFSESPFQDGPIAQAVNDVSAAGRCIFPLPATVVALIAGPPARGRGTSTMAVRQQPGGVAASTILEEARTIIRCCCPRAPVRELISSGLTRWVTRPTITMCMCWTRPGWSSAVRLTPRPGRAATLTN